MIWVARKCFWWSKMIASLASGGELSIPLVKLKFSTNYKFKVYVVTKLENFISNSIDKVVLVNYIYLNNLEQKIPLSKIRKSFG